MNIHTDLSVISRLGITLKVIKFLEAVLTVGTIAFTVSRIIKIFNEVN